MLLPPVEYENAHIQTSRTHAPQIQRWRKGGKSEAHKFDEVVSGQMVMANPLYARQVVYAFKKLYTFTTVGNGVGVTDTACYLHERKGTNLYSFPYTMYTFSNKKETKNWRGDMMNSRMAMNRRRYICINILSMLFSRRFIRCVYVYACVLVCVKSYSSIQCHSISILLYKSLVYASFCKGCVWVCVSEQKSHHKHFFCSQPRRLSQLLKLWM